MAWIPREHSAVVALKQEPSASQRLMGGHHDGMMAMLAIEPSSGAPSLERWHKTRCHHAAAPFFLSSFYILASNIYEKAALIRRQASAGSTRARRSRRKAREELYIRGSDGISRAFARPKNTPANNLQSPRGTSVIFFIVETRSCAAPFRVQIAIYRAPSSSFRTSRNATSSALFAWSCFKSFR